MHTNVNNILPSLLCISLDNDKQHAPQNIRLCFENPAKEQNCCAGNIKEGAQKIAVNSYMNKAITVFRRFDKRVNT